jgi:hypothetical protein
MINELITRRKKKRITVPMFLHLKRNDPIVISTITNPRVAIISNPSRGHQVEYSQWLEIGMM